MSPLLQWRNFPLCITHSIGMGCLLLFPHYAIIPQNLEDHRDVIICNTACIHSYQRNKNWELLKWRTARIYALQMHPNDTVFLEVIYNILIHSFHFSCKQLSWSASLISAPVESTPTKKSSVCHRTGSHSLGKYLILNVNISNDR